jgi:hypothetical protein
MAYAVHTDTCTYLLDDDGVCRWIVSQRGVVPAHVQQCIGAQFVACLDMKVIGGLLGTLSVGARALFVKNTGTQMIMLRTGRIEHVDDRRAGAQEEDEPRGLVAASANSPPEPPPPPPLGAGRVPQGGLPMPAAPQQYGKRGGMPTLPPPRFGVVEHTGEEATVTVSLTRGR